MKKPKHAPQAPHHSRKAIQGAAALIANFFPCREEGITPMHPGGSNQMKFSVSSVH
jgi:hypothetical protein